MCLSNIFMIQLFFHFALNLPKVKFSQTAYTVVSLKKKNPPELSLPLLASSQKTSLNPPLHLLLYDFPMQFLKSFSPLFTPPFKLVFCSYAFPSHCWVISFTSKMFKASLILQLLRGQGLRCHEFKNSVGYRERLGPAWVT